MLSASAAGQERYETIALSYVGASVCVFVLLFTSIGYHGKVARRKGDVNVLGVLLRQLGTHN